MYVFCVSVFIKDLIHLLLEDLMDMLIFGMVLIKKDYVNFIVIILELHLYALVMMVSKIF